MEVSWLIVAESSERDSDGRQSIHNIFNHITFHLEGRSRGRMKYPYFEILARLRISPQDTGRVHPFDIRITAPDGEVAHGRSEFPALDLKTWASKTPVVKFWRKDFVFTTEGEYTIGFYDEDDQLKAEEYLLVSLKE